MAEFDLGKTLAQGALNVSSEGIAKTSGAGTLITGAALNRRMKRTWKALFSGVTSPTAWTNPLLKIGVFGDSVGASRAGYITQRLADSIGNAGGTLTAFNLASGATVISDPNTTGTWINGASVYTIPSGGSIEWFAGGGGRQLATKLQVWYVVEPGGGTFKIQSTSGGAFADEAGFTSISCSGTLGGAVATITKSAGSSWALKTVGVSGTCRIICAVAVDETGKGVALYRFDTGGLALDTARSAPSAIKTPIFQALDLDLALAEFKDNAEFAAGFADWTDWYTNTVNRDTDWVWIGTSPEAIELTTGSWNVRNNALQKAWCDAGNGIYFDGYGALKDYPWVDGQGWENDGTHLAAPANAFSASQLWAYLGFDCITQLPMSSPVSTTRADFRGVASWSWQGVEVGRAGKIGDGTDFWILGNRSIRMGSLASGTMRAQIACAGETSYFDAVCVGSSYGATTPMFYQVTLNGAAGLALGPKDAGANLTSLRILRTYVGPDGAFDAAGAGTPEGAVTAPIGSTYRRTDGGAGTSFYVKESGTGNTGWVGK